MDIREVAKRAKVSTATVSRAVNRVPTVDAKLARRVWKVIDELGYFPNTQARALVSGRNRIFRLIVSEITNPFFPEIVQVFEDVVVRHNYEILLTSTVHDPDRLEIAVRRMIERRVDGVAVMTFGMEDEVLQDAKLRNLLLVFIDVGPERPRVGNIKIDYLSGIRQVAQRLAALRHRRIAFVSGRLRLKTAVARKKAFTDSIEVLGRIARMKDNDDAAQAKLASIRSYVSTNGVPEQALLKMAKLGAVVDRWMADTEVAISAVQCWTSIEENLGIVPCTVMSMMSNELLSSACEVDICGVLGMHALRLASETPSALLDWNNNYGADPDKAVCFHRSNLPKHFFRDAKMDYQAIIAGTVGKENTFGTCTGLVKAGPMSFARFSTDDTSGKMRGYVGEGAFTDDPLNTFGGAGVVQIPNMQKLLQFICERGFEHHVAANLSTVAAAVHEATTRYLGWDMYFHGGHA